MKDSTQHITILGGGPAGLAAGYYSKKSGIGFTVYEASAVVGGNCRTIEHNGFLFDTGAHRLHDRVPDITHEIAALLGDRLKNIYVPSRIYTEGKFIDFPLTPFDLLKKIGLKEFIASGWEMMKARYENASADDFKTLAIHAYGRRIAERFLLNYSEKLWGLPCERLSVNVAGKRLKGLDLRTFLLEAFAGGKAKTRHIDGDFWYPEKGIGEIFDKVAEVCGKENIRLNSRVTRLFHNDHRITTIEVNNNKRIGVDHVVSSLPLSMLVRMMDPVVPRHILDAASSLRFRHVLLVCFLINKPSVTGDATIYFPSEKFAFTRLYEPRNRSPLMSPPGRTSIVAEIPCFTEDRHWTATADEMIAMVKGQLLSTGLVREGEIEDAITYRVPYAYPVLEKGSEQKMKPLQEYFSRFTNLHEAGRGGMFKYTHIHDMFMRARDIVKEISS